MLRFPPPGNIIFTPIPTPVSSAVLDRTGSFASSPAAVFGKSLDQFTPLPLVPGGNTILPPAAQSFSLTPQAMPAADTGASSVIKMVLLLLSNILKNKGTTGGQKGVLSPEKPGATSSKDQKTGTKLPPQTTKVGNGSTIIAEGKGWDNNVSVFTSSKADETSFGTITGEGQKAKYITQLQDAMKQGKTLTEAHDSLKVDGQTPARNANAKLDSLVPGKGGKAVLVTGDGIQDSETKDLAETLKKTYGMEVEVIHDSSPKQLEEAMKKMGQTGGSQSFVAVMSHGAKDDSGKNNGNMALGKGDGDQWLSEEKLQGMVNKYLAPSFDNVNVVINSCYAGNYVQ